MNIDKERRKFLRQELKKYEKCTPMTDEERSILHEWVRDGHSVHENPSMAVYEGGGPVDFLNVYREEEAINRALASMSDEERSQYLLDEYGIGQNGGMDLKPPTYETLRKKANRLYRTCSLFWEFLMANDLKEEACEYVQERIDEEWPFEPFDWDFGQEEMLPWERP